MSSVLHHGLLKSHCHDGPTLALLTLLMVLHMWQAGAGEAAAAAESVGSPGG